MSAKHFAVATESHCTEESEPKPTPDAPPVMRAVRPFR